MHPGVAQHEFEVCLYEMATNNSQPQFSHSSSSSVTVNIGALSNAIATAIGQAASPAQQVTATFTIPSSSEASPSR